MILCRVCFTTSRLIPLTSDRIESHMLNEFTIIINGEQQLPKYICEKCANNLDIAYAFKRQYENSIVKFMRSTSYQCETIKSEENMSNKMYSQHEGVEGDQSDLEDIRTDGLNLVNYTVVRDYSGDNEIDIEEMDVKLFTSTTTLDTPLDGGPLIADVASNPTKEELTGHSSSNLNWQAESQLIQNNVVDAVTTEKGNSAQTEAIECSNDAQELSPIVLLHRHTTVEKSSQHTDLQYEPLSSDILRKIYTFRYDRYGKPYKCDVCSRHFVTKGHVKAHRMRHIEGARKIKCNKCSLTFLTKPHFDNHQCLP